MDNRLEFSVKQQLFHFGENIPSENRNGWVVIAKSCSDDEHLRFMDLIDSFGEKHISINDCFVCFNEIKTGNDITKKIAKEIINLN